MDMTSEEKLGRELSAKMGVHSFVKEETYGQGKRNS
jgi:hypothetical protein